MSVDHLRGRPGAIDWLRALKQFDDLSIKSPLAMTGKELEKVGTVPQALIEQPEMTLVETMSDEEVITYLLRLLMAIKNIFKLGPTDQFSQIALQHFTITLSHSLDYLSQIGRLSSAF